MPDDSPTSLRHGRAMTADVAPADEGLSLGARRARALGRRAGQLANRLIGRQPIIGFVDRVMGGDVRGWAFDPNRPGRRVHVVARCEGRVVAETLADLARRDLIQEGRGDGRHAFSLRLPPAMLDGAPRRIRIEAVSRFGRTRLTGGDLLLGLEVSDGPMEPGAPVTVDAGRSGRAKARASQTAAALLIWGEGGEAALERTAASWRAQGWPELALARLGEAAAGLRGLGRDDESALRSFAAGVHTVVFARAGDVFGEGAARALVEARPLGDVVTWDGPSAAERRPEARALGVLLGEGLGGLFAVRGPALAGSSTPMTGLLAGRGPRPLELALAGRPELRWTHLPAALARRAESASRWLPVEAADAEGLPGCRWLEGRDGAPSRLVPAASPSRLTVAVWPEWSAASDETLKALLAHAPSCELEILVPADALEEVRGWAEAMAPGRIVARAVDAPQGGVAGGGTGAWLRVLGEAASGEAVVMCRAGVRLAGPAGVLEEIAAWACSELAGSATVELAQGGRTLAGLGLQRTGSGWRAASAFEPSRGSQARPVLAAPAAFMTVSRARLAALGGIDDRRFPAAGADLDLGLRLRRVGGSAVLLGWASALVDDGVSLGTGIEGAALAPFDPSELASAAVAFPAGDEGR